MQLMRTPLQLAPVWMLALLLAACAGGPQPAKQTVEQRAHARWQHLIEDDWNAAYGFLTPGVRDLMSREAYRDTVRLSKVRWKTASVGKVDCPAEDRCRVNVQVGFTLTGVLTGAPSIDSFQPVEETWLRVDGVWYFLPRQPAG
jgi:hypothetical protein